MIRRFFRSASLLALPVFLAVASSAFAQQKEVPLHRPQHEIAEDLASPDRLTASRALSDYMYVRKEERTRQLRDALALSLERENERTRAFYLSGEMPPPEEYNYMYGFHLAGDVLDLRDPAYIDVLLPWLGGSAMSPWIDMGKEAIQPVLEFVYAHEPGYEEDIVGGILLLQIMVDHWGLDAFSSSEQEQLRQIALRYISNENGLGNWSMLSRAINLASAIGDAELIRMAQAITEDEDELAKRSDNDEWIIDWIRGHVSRAVSGTRKPYRYLTPEEDGTRIDALYKKFVEDPEAFDSSE